MNKQQREARTRKAAESITPRGVDRHQAAIYTGTSVDFIDRAVQSGALPVVRFPVARDRKSNRGVPGTLKRVILDVRDLDKLIDRSKERVG